MNGTRDSRGKQRGGSSQPPGMLEDDAGHQEPWLISYADMMTLLVGLFVMMFSFASFDKASMDRMSKALKGTFGTEVVKRDSKALAGSIKEAMAMTPYFRDMEIRPIENGLEVSFTTTALFQSGSADLTTDAEKAIRALAGRVRSYGKEIRIKVEGHTDDVPISSPRYSSNWVLSSARAATIVELFESSHFPPDRLETEGFGSSRPLLPNRDLAGNSLPDNQAKNRRVAIKVLLRDSE